MTLESLTPRQREVAELVAEGMTNAAIAERLGINEQSVKVHLSSIYRRLGLTYHGSYAPRVRLARLVFEDQVGELVAELLEQDAA